MSSPEIKPERNSGSTDEVAELKKKLAATEDKLFILRDSHIALMEEFVQAQLSIAKLVADLRDVLKELIAAQPKDKLDSLSLGASSSKTWAIDEDDGA